MQPNHGSAKHLRLEAQFAQPVAHFRRRGQFLDANSGAGLDPAVEDVIATDLAPRDTSFFNAEIPLDGQINLKKVTRQAVRELERKVILKVLQNHHWNRKQAARALSISYWALLYKIRDAGLPSSRVVKRREAISPKQEIAAD